MSRKNEGKRKINKGSSGQNRKSSNQYIEKYAQKEGVLCTESGLLYRVLETGDGMVPNTTDRVRVNQRISIVGGKVIADTYKTGEPDKFTMKEAIPGIREGLQLMNAGARFEFVVPAELAWGKKGVGNKIGPNAVLIFDIRLLEVSF